MKMLTRTAVYNSEKNEYCGDLIIGEVAEIKPIYRSIWRHRGWLKTNHFWSAYSKPQTFGTNPNEIYGLVIKPDGEFFILNSSNMIRKLLDCE